MLSLTWVQQLERGSSVSLPEYHVHLDAATYTGRQQSESTTEAYIRFLENEYNVAIDYEPDAKVYQTYKRVRDKDGNL